MRYTFGDYTLDMHGYELCRAGTPLKLHTKIFDLLVYLIEHRDRVVTRQELFDTLWPKQVVSDDALDWAISTARRAIGDSGRAQRMIKTTRGRGYRLVAPIEEYSQTLPDEIPRDAPASEAEVRIFVPSSVDGERKLATLLACSLSSGVREMEAIDPEVLHCAKATPRRRQPSRSTNTCRPLAWHRRPRHPISCAC